ncbi:PASTA domain-containing protein [Candidatus Endoriftia persephonae]|jgi:hypothetical protein|uniref:PASTA domain-containing protein n=2 Tax=Gammaproteobacteria TaxID=1236 RepID=G2FDT6_9GAMM|nr:PASTA domain-containing protein [Candidatus Endoriftia persephone]EGW55141.1 hypothetical protein TevJSym_af01060 [endosymbiont of Tevnia jerichonana (vent Tica)]USF88253.1 PASTA domain-containing protein [Candidatus Endoriftia persephone]
MSGEIRDLVRDVVASPLGDIIASVGEGVAEAQQVLDDGALAKTLEIYSEGGEAALALLRDIGYRPTFYALPETTGEVRVSLHLGRSIQGGATPTSATAPQPAVATQLSRIGRNLGIRPRLYATPVDAGYANRYGYQANISAKLTFKIIPVPAPEGADELRKMPNLVGHSLIESRTIADSLGLEIRLQDSQGDPLDTADEASLVTAQQPAGEQIVRLGDEILLTLG